MLLKFSFDNFYSFKNNAEINLYCNGIKDSTDYDSYFVFKNEKILKTIGIFGDVSSGKTNLILSLNLFKDFIIDKKALPQIKPFMFDNDNKDKPICFYIEFIYKKIKYIYSLKISNNKIIYEEGYFSPNGRSTLIFKRASDSIFLHKRLFSIKDKKILDLNLNGEESILFLANNFNIKILKDFYNYFKNYLVFAKNNYEFNENLLIKRLQQKDFNSFLNQYLISLDFNINGLKVDTLEEKSRLLVEYKTSKGLYTKELKYESKGFIKLIFLSTYIFDCLKEEKILFIDDIDENINFGLEKALLTIFLDKSINIYNSQIVFTCNDIKLLSANLLRRDEIYFIEKDNTTNISKLYCLSKDFAVRKFENIEHGYILGRYIKSCLREKVLLKIKK